MFFDIIFIISVLVFIGIIGWAVVYEDPLVRKIRTTPYPKNMPDDCKKYDPNHDGPTPCEWPYCDCWQEKTK